MKIERLTGEKDKLSGHVANEIIQDFQMATSYPPQERVVVSAQDLAHIVTGLCEKIQIERENKSAATDS